MTITFGSLFSGIGGLDLGLERVGFECKWQCEIDEFCNQILEKSWPNVRRIRDVRNVSRSTVETVDIICGGFPCQPVSLAGRRKGKGDHRWLWPQFARVVDELRPKYVIVENVPGLLSLGGSEVIADLACLGYDARWHLVSASALGAPHIRKRLFIIGSDPNSKRKLQPKRLIASKWRWPGDICSKVPDTMRKGLSRQRKSLCGIQTKDLGACDSGWWATEPDICRVAYGVPRRMDRIRALGNAVVPQCAEFIAREFINEPA